MSHKKALPNHASLSSPDYSLEAWVSAGRQWIEARSRDRIANEQARQWAHSLSWSAAAQKTVEVYRLVRNP